MVLYGVEVWGGSISPSTWNDIEKRQKAFLRRHLGVKVTMPYSILLLEKGSKSIDMKVKRLLRKSWEGYTNLVDLLLHSQLATLDIYFIKILMHCDYLGA